MNAHFERNNTHPYQVEPSHGWGHPNDGTWRVRNAVTGDIQSEGHPDAAVAAIEAARAASLQ